MLRSNARFAVESLAVANLATANFLAAADFVDCSGFAPLVPASLGFEAAAPMSDFFLIAIFTYPFKG
jgi:hypothetical protein